VTVADGSEKALAQDASNIAAIALSDTNLFWVEGDRLWTSTLLGAEPRQLSAGVHPTSLTQTGDWLAWSSASGLSLCQLSCGTTHVIEGVASVAALAFNGEQIAIATQDGELWTGRIEDRALRTLRSLGVPAIAIGLWGSSSIVVLTSQGEVDFVDLKSGETYRSLTYLRNVVAGSFSRDGQTLRALSQDGVVLTLNLAAGREVASQSAVPALDAARLGAAVVAAEGSPLLCAVLSRIAAGSLSIGQNQSSCDFPSQIDLPIAMPGELFDLGRGRVAVAANDAATIYDANEHSLLALDEGLGPLRGVMQRGSMVALLWERGISRHDAQWLPSGPPVPLAVPIRMASPLADTTRVYAVDILGRIVNVDIDGVLVPLGTPERSPESIMASSDGQYLILTDAEGGMTRYASKGLVIETRLQSPSSRIAGVAPCRGASCFIAYSEDGTASVWDWQKRRPKCTVPYRNFVTTSAATDATGSVGYLGGRQGAVAAIDLEKCTVTSSVQGSLHPLVRLLVSDQRALAIEADNISGLRAITFSLEGNE
jgi:WD40 repeat protein